MKTTLSLFLILFISTSLVRAQNTPQEQVHQNPVTNTFWAPLIVGMGTVRQLYAHNLDVTLRHTFGIATIDPLQRFFGLDILPNVRLGADYGISNRWSIGIGRTSNLKLYDFRTKVALLRQTQSSSIPISISLKGDVGLSTLKDNLPVRKDLSSLISLMIARKFNSHLSLQAAPMYAHFTSGRETNLVGIGIGGAYHFTPRVALSAEYYPVIGKRNPNTKNAFDIAVDIRAGGGGHVFKLFFTSSYWQNEQFILARNNDNFFEKDFRFGFDINRLFYGLFE
jgi:hypothetical protein